MRIVRFAAFLGVVAGCYSPSPQEGAPCQSSSQCPTPQRCVLGSCSLRDAPAIDASPPDPDAAIDAPAPPIDAPRLACSTAGLTCANTLTMFTCGGNCWVYCRGAVGHDTARARCGAWMGVIGEINDAAEQDCVDNQVVTTSWIGLRQAIDATTPSTGWTWNEVTPVVYTHWLMNKPDDGDQNESRAEQCATMRPDGFWDDNECGQVDDFFCERP